MAEYSKFYITNDGQTLIAKMIAGSGNIDFTKVCSSSTQYTESQLQTLTALSNIKQTTLVSKVTRTNEVAIKIDAAYSNVDLKEGYYMRTLGLYAVDPDKGEILYAVCIEKSNNCYMGYSTIAGYLNRQDIPKMPSKNSHGRKFVDWSIHHIKRMLDNPVYTGRIAFGRTRLERVEGTENEYRRVKSDDYILSDEVVHEPIISDELFEAAKRKRQETTTTGNPRVGRYAKHLLSGILKCPMCGSSMYADIVLYVKWIKCFINVVVIRLLYK